MKTRNCKEKHLGLGDLASLVIIFCINAWAGDAHQPPNIILLSVDTLRADFLGCYGYPGQISPNIDILARQGVLFEDVLTTIGKTGPAFTSLFTSQYPPTTGARRNGRRMRPDMITLAERLKKRGYVTWAVISNWVLRAKLSGLQRGFDRYDQEFSTRRSGPVAEERLAPDVTQKACEWLQQVPSRPLFFWVHYSDPHSPYTFHQEFPVPLPAGESKHRGLKKRRAYASEVRFTDYWIGQFLDTLWARIPRNKTCLVFLSDHGESLGEHGTWGHGKNVLQPNLRIPLIIIGPGIPRGKRTRFPASIVDLMPTILALARIKEPPGCRGKNLLGVWDKPISNQRRRFAFADRGAVLAFHAPRKHRNPLAVCMVKGRWKTVYHFRYDYFQFYDLVDDPEELHPYVKQQPRECASFSHELMQWYNDLPKYHHKADSQPKLTNEDIERLKSLGY